MSNLIDSVNHVVVVTGAGFSAPSGMPVYRSDGANWLNPKLGYLSESHRYGMYLEELWPHWHELAFAAAGSGPNPAHLALARWEQLLTARDEPGSMTVVTQNVDELHTRAGSTNVLEVHGSILTARRLHKASPHFAYEPMAQEHPGTPPVAPDGSRRTRPDIVLFGERPRHMRTAVAAITKADLVIFAGTSGRVWPVAGLVEVANAAQTPTMLWNETPWDHGKFDFTVQDSVLALDELIPKENR